MKTASLHALLGRDTDSSLILMAGPVVPRMKGLVARIHIPSVDFKDALDIRALRKAVASKGSIAVIACVPEIEGALDKTAFGTRLITLAYAADRIVYCGAERTVLVSPQTDGGQLVQRKGRRMTICPQYANPESEPK